MALCYCMKTRTNIRDHRVQWNLVVDASKYSLAQHLSSKSINNEIFLLVQQHFMEALSEKKFRKTEWCSLGQLGHTSQNGAILRDVNGLYTRKLSLTFSFCSDKGSSFWSASSCLEHIPRNRLLEKGDLAIIMIINVCQCDSQNEVASRKKNYIKRKEMLIGLF